MYSLKCFALLWKGGREGEDEGFLYGNNVGREIASVAVGEKLSSVYRTSASLCYPKPDETGLLNICLFC